MTLPNRATHFFLAFAALALVVFVLIVTSSAGAARAQEANGKYDTDGDGLIEISNLEQLDAIRYDPDGDGAPNHHYYYPDVTPYTAAFPVGQGEAICTSGCNGYELTRSLLFNDPGSYASGMVSTEWTTGSGWEPIGNNHIPFQAVFFGNGLNISDLYINRAGEDFIGLFGFVSRGSLISQVGLVSVNVTGGNFVGGLVGYGWGGSTIADSNVEGSVSGGGSGVGGLVGNSNSDITDSYASGSVSGAAGGSVGGLVGTIEGGTISGSYATGSVSGGHSAGGLVGQSFTGSITTSYSKGSVTGDWYVGGLVGENYAPIIASYSTGSVTGGESGDGYWVGGLVGLNGADTIMASYWNTSTSGQNAGLGIANAQRSGVTGKTTPELQAPTGYTGIYAGWNVDLDNADGDGDPATGGDDPWDFGTSSQYPALRGISLGIQRTPTVTPIPTPAPEVIADRQALMAFYNTMGGENWDRRDNWGTGAPVEHWQGVLTDDDGRVIILNLNRNNLTGNVPPEVVNLTALKELRLQDNGLSGPIPAWLSSNQLSSLELLNLSDNRLSGEIPDSLADLPNLEVLWLHDNQFTGCTPRVLKGLVTTGRGVLPDFCSIPDHPEERAALVALYQATWEDPGDFGGKFSWRADLYKYWQEDVHSPLPVFDDCIEDFETRWRLGTVTPVEFLELSELLLAATTPEDPTRLGCLEEGHLVRAAWRALESLIKAGLYTKLFPWPKRDGWDTWDTDEPLPLNEWYGVEIDDIDGHVIELDLSGNNLDGEILGRLGDLTALKTLNLSGNHLNGSIPWQLSKLSNLKDMNLSSNEFTGPIPHALESIVPGEGGSLENMYLFGNDLDGCIPRLLIEPLEQGLNTAEQALVTYNPSAGEKSLDVVLQEIVTRFVSQTSITLPVNQALAIYQHSIKPTYGLWLPPCPPQPPELPLEFDGREYAHESHYTDKQALLAIRGHFVAEGSDESKFEDWLDDRDHLNLVTADKHCGVGAWHGVETKRTSRWDPAQGSYVDDCRVVELSLDKRVLTGSIPKEVGHLTRLEKLNISRNCLTGPIPAELGHLSLLEDLGLNQLSLEELAKLRRQGADGCGFIPSLEGELPPELGNLKLLGKMNLHDNRYLGGTFSESDEFLPGELPPEFGNMVNLGPIKIHNTGLAGCLPPSLARNFEGSSATAVITPILTAGAGAALGAALGNPLSYWAGIFFGEIVGRVLGVIIDPIANPAAESPIPFVGSELGNVKLYCYETTAAATVGSVPMVALSVDDSQPRMIRIGSPIPVTATFTESVSGFTVDDVTVGNGTVDNFLGNGAVYTFEVTPNAIGQVTVDIAADVAEDADGNGNTAAAQLQLGIPYDDNHNGVIEIGELFTAIDDYLDGSVESSHLFDLIDLYLSGQSAS